MNVVLRRMNTHVSNLTILGDTRGRANALADLGRSHLAMGACGSAVSYLRQALVATEGLADVDEEVILYLSSVCSK